jgi:hypothetical protein
MTADVLTAEIGRAEFAFNQGKPYKGMNGIDLYVYIQELYARNRSGLLPEGSVPKGASFSDYKNPATIKKV